MSHDQLAKTLIATFFPDFLRLTLPDTSLRLRLGEAIFLDKEIYKGWPTGDRWELDLLVKVPVEDKETYLLIHVEIEARARAGMDQRLWRYYMQIRLHHELLVLPILVNLRGGRPGVGLEALEEGFEPLSTGVFRYRVLGLSGCQAADWLARPEPIAWALAALMRPGDWSRAELKVECLRRIRQSGITGSRKEVLLNWIETYVQLSAEDAAEYQRLLTRRENGEVRRMALTWMEKVFKEGKAAGKSEAAERMQTWVGKARAQGFKKGKAEGKGEAAEQIREIILQRIAQQFGVVPERVRAKVEATASLPALAGMLEKLPLLQTPDDLLPNRRGRVRIPA